MTLTNYLFTYILKVVRTLFKNCFNGEEEAFLSLFDILLLQMALISECMLTDNVQETQLTLHGIRVYLTHIPSPVRLPQLLDMYMPCPVVWVRHADPVIFGDHVVMNGQYGLCVYPQPCHLYRMKTQKKRLKMFGLKIYVYMYFLFGRVHRWIAQTHFFL